MRKYSILILFLLLCIFDVVGQDLALAQFNAERLQINKLGMITLGSWALGNMAVNGVLLRNPASDEQAHFYRMNIFWNVVNLGLAIPGLRHSLITDPASLDMASTVSEFHQMGKILIFNAGLDMAYITGGFLMKEMAKTRENKRDILRGYGRSLILQGGFLLAFDIVLFSILQSKNPQLTELINEVSFNGSSIALTFPLF